MCVYKCEQVHQCVCARMCVVACKRTFVGISGNVYVHWYACVQGFV